jgi:hypothetical protein
MGETLIIIQQGDPVVVEDAITFIGTGSEGDPGACRRLVFPATISPLLAPVVYEITGTQVCLNPDRTLNFDKVPLFHPITTSVLTIGSRRDIRFEEQEEDVIVTEIWEANQIPMPTSFFRLLYEYLINSPPFTTGQTDFVVWEPRDKSTRTYNVNILSLSVGGAGGGEGGSGEQRFDVQDFREPGGLSSGGNIQTAMDSLNVLPTGVVDREVRLRMRIISEVT